ncbi:MAG: gamma-glutamyl hercynylcysteine S-oxide synthase [Thermoleophilaceae bacterium]|nr:gamma-glutamyl hercynylcysteine S-oxide synthase [Thermoleophilaceae bacterium]
MREQLADTRHRTLELVAQLDDDVMHRPLDPIMSPLVWDLAHIAAYEDLWAVHRLGGEPLMHGDLAATYDAFETPRAVRSQIELLDRQQALAYMGDVRSRTLDVLDRVGPNELHDLVILHELQHTETMRQALYLGGQPGGEPDSLPSISAEAEWIEIDAGSFQMGAERNGRFVYDNELPQHPVTTGAFAIQSFPVTNGSFLSFAEGGGYEYRPWWSDEGWSWKQCYDITPPGSWAGGAPSDLGAPVQHISWFEADAFARSQGARLPTEAEWERAATWDQGAGLRAVGAVWEWTTTDFAGYPGFEAFPYREYSQVFFDKGYRVLRGGSWATAPSVATSTFRNWDLPERRQIFSGVRLARD